MRVVIISGTVFGTSEEVAHTAAELLQQQGHNVDYRQRWELAQLLELQPQAVLFVCSTTGMGEAPPALIPLLCEMEEQMPDWAGLPVGVVALGDSCYGENFCAGGEYVLEVTQLLGMVELQPMLRIDSSETVTHAEDAKPWLSEWGQALLNW